MKLALNEGLKARRHVAGLVTKGSVLSGIAGDQTIDRFHEATEEIEEKQTPVGGRLVLIYKALNRAQSTLQIIRVRFRPLARKARRRGARKLDETFGQRCENDSTRLNRVIDLTLRNDRRRARRKRNTGQLCLD